MERHDDSVIVIAWRGTMIPFEWAENLKTDLKPIKLSDNIEPSSLNPKVENGFLSAVVFTNLRPPL